MDRARRGGRRRDRVTAVVDDPFGYGRIVRSGEQIARIVEERDASPAERAIQEINAGIYAFELDGLFDAVRGIAAGNTQGEYYLPDLVAALSGAGPGVETLAVSNADEIRGINSRAELADVSRILRQQKNAELMAAGVTLEDPATAYIGPDVEIGADTIIHPGVTLEGRTRIGRGCEIHSGVRIADSELGDGVDDPQSLRHHGRRVASRRERRAVRAPAQRRRRRRGRAGRQFRRAEEDRARRGLEGDAPRVPRRRDDRRAT